MDPFAAVVMDTRSSASSLVAGEIENMRWVTITSEIIERMSSGDLVRALDDVRAAYAASSSRAGSVREPRFYAWVDELAGQLRFSVTTADPLPFGGSIRVTVDAEVIAQQALALTTVDGVIRWSDLGDNLDLDSEDPVPRPLDVYVADLYR